MEKKELVIVPTPGMGHLLSTVEVAKLIVARDHRISIVILIINFPFDFSAVNAYVDSQSRDADPDGRLTFIPLPSLSNLPDLTSRNSFSTFIELYKPHVKQTILDRVQSGSPKPTAFVLDMFCATMVDVANELHIPTYFFFTSGASLLNLMFRLQSLADNDGVNIVEEFSDPDKETDVPGFRNRVPGKVVPSVFLDKEGGSEMILTIARRFRESKGIIVNTYVELESYGTQALLEQAEDNKIPPIYPVGPILELDNKSRGGGGSHKEDHDSNIMEWLDNQPPSSVVFLCFGSMGSFGEDQVKEIANGLESSGHRFLWSLRKPAPKGKPGVPSQHEIFVEALPEGFLERTAERGKVIGWAAQVAILAHQAIGGFVSHCGWNSTLESVWFGVPMAT